MQEQMNLKISQEDGSIALLAEELKKQMLETQVQTMIFLSKLRTEKKKSGSRYGVRFFVREFFIFRNFEFL